MASFH